MENPASHVPGNGPAMAASPQARRAFLGGVGTLALGAAAYLAPLAAGIAAFLNPLRAKSQTGQWFRLASLDTLPADGTPRKFAMVAERVDAWTHAREPVGAVFLRRTGPKTVEALQVVCPHAGCPVDYRESADPATGQVVRKFLCGCHKASFDLSGKRIDAVSPSPRDMDRLKVDKKRLPEVWVEFKNFQLGTSTPGEVA